MTRADSVLGDGPLLTPAKVAELLAVSEVTLARWRRTGKGPAFLKLQRGRSGLVRYRLSDVEAFLGACSRASTSDPGTP